MRTNEPCPTLQEAVHASVAGSGGQALGVCKSRLAGSHADLKHYLGAVGAAGYERAAREAIEESEEVTLVITPERVLTQDFSQETPWFGKAWLVLKRALPPGL